MNYYVSCGDIYDKLPFRMILKSDRIAHVGKIRVIGTCVGLYEHRIIVWSIINERTEIFGKATIQLPYTEIQRLHIQCYTTYRENINETVKNDYRSAFYSHPDKVGVSAYHYNTCDTESFKKALEQKKVDEHDILEHVFVDLQEKIQEQGSYQHVIEENDTIQDFLSHHLALMKDIQPDEYVKFRQKFEVLQSLRYSQEELLEFKRKRVRENCIKRLENYLDHLKSSRMSQEMIDQEYLEIEDGILREYEQLLAYGYVQEMQQFQRKFFAQRNMRYFT